MRTWKDLPEVGAVEAMMVNESCLSVCLWVLHACLAPSPGCRIRMKDRASTSSGQDLAFHIQGVMTVISILMFS